MNENTINEIRTILFEKLATYEGEPIKLDLDEDILKRILFDYYEDFDYYSFAREYYFNVKTRDLFKKIDYSNVSFDKFDCYSDNFSFEGFKGVKINPQKLAQLSFKNAKFYGVEFIGSFDGVDISRADFTGSIGAIINPPTVNNKSLYNTKLCGVTIQGSFDGCIIEGANFSGANGDLEINPQTIFKKNLKYTTLNGVKFIGSFNDASIRGADFTGSVGAVINPQTI